MNLVLCMSLFRSTDLVLVDAGALTWHYRSDITRTWPVSGRFTPPQAELYSLVLEVQKSAIAKCRASLGFSLYQLYLESLYELTTGLRRLGFTVSPQVRHDPPIIHTIMAMVVGSRRSFVSARSWTSSRPGPARLSHSLKEPCPTSWPGHHH